VFITAWKDVIAGTVEEDIDVQAFENNMILIFTCSVYYN
jgi:hypothetical protein